MEVLERLQKAGIIPVVVIEDAKDAVPLAEALQAGGADTVEVTFRTGAAAEAIRLITGACPDLLVGAGTVVTLDQCKEADSYTNHLPHGVTKYVSRSCTQNSQDRNPHLPSR